MFDEEKKKLYSLAGDSGSGRVLAPRIALGQPLLYHSFGKKNVFMLMGTKKNNFWLMGMEQIDQRTNMSQGGNKFENRE